MLRRGLETEFDGLDFVLPSLVSQGFVDASQLLINKNEHAFKGVLTRGFRQFIGIAYYNWNR
jgi:hypothetical protein